MDEILIACGDVELLRKIAGDLPSGRFKPIATKKAGGIPAKLASRDVRFAVIHETLADEPGALLCAKLKASENPPVILYLSSGSPPSEGPFDLALRYPLPGPVFRNAIARLVPETESKHNLSAWRDFYHELADRIEKLPKQSYYQILGVDKNAPHHHIVAVYDQLSIRYHPDRYVQFRGTNWGNAIYENSNILFQAVVDAFSVLSDRRKKKTYDRNLSSGELRLDAATKAGQDTGPDLLENQAETKQGKKFLRLAQNDIARKDWGSALQNLKFAASMEGDVPAIAEKIEEVESKLEK